MSDDHAAAETGRSTTHADAQDLVDEMRRWPEELRRDVARAALRASNPGASDLAVEMTADLYCRRAGLPAGT